jgi:ribosomal-protein-alanine N-acetyltransferase
MAGRDLDRIMELEHKAFTCPWTRGMYERELEKEESCYLTIRVDGTIIAYGGVLLLLEEAHVMTMAVMGEYRRRGVATRLLLEMISSAEAMGARFITLEVRVSNDPAIELYRKFGFQIMGERKKYYMDNFENALIMWTEDITTQEYRRLLDSLWRGCLGHGQAG